VFRIRTDLNTDPDPDPAFEVNSDPGFFMTKIKEIFLFENLLFFQSQIAINTLIEDFQAQVKPIRPPTNW